MSRSNHLVLRLGLLFAISAFIVILFWSSFSSIIAMWDTSDHRHGIVVFPIAVFLVWRMRNNFAAAPIKVDYRATSLLLPLLSAWVIARLAGIQGLEHFVVLALIPVAVWLFMGGGVTRNILFPLCFPIFAIPITDAFVPSLMVVTADISTALLELSGFPVFREGQYISLPGGEFVVADVCSGVRYLITGIMVAALFAYLTYESVGKRMILIAVIGVSLVIANGFRAYIVMAVASTTNMQYLGGRDHIYFGWLLFGVVMMLLMWIGTRYADFDDAKDSVDKHHQVAEMAPSAIPLIGVLGLIMLAVTVKPLQSDIGPLTVLLVAVSALLVFVVLVARHRHVKGESLAGAVLNTPHSWKESGIAVAAILVLLWTPRYVAAVEEGAPHEVMRVSFRPEIGCPVTGSWTAPWQPQFEAADASAGETYRCDEGLVNVYSASYETTQQGRELISSSNRPTPANWDRISTVSTNDVYSGDKSWSVKEVRVETRGYEALIWYWYEVDGTRATSETRTKMLQILALATGKPAGGRIILLETQMQSNAKAAEARLRSVALAVAGADP